MSGDDMDIALAGEADDDRVKDDSCERSKCKQGARSSKSTRYRATETDFYQRRLVDITRDKPIKVVVRVALPVRDHPKFNFVGKLLGPKGNSLKRLQEETLTKMAILGRGSMRDRHKEEELRNCGDPRFSHLSDELHVEVTAFAPPAEAHARIAYALSEVRRFLVPDYNDEIRQEQMWEMRVLNRSSSPNHDCNDDDGDDDGDDNGDGDDVVADNNNDHHSIDKNVELRASCIGISPINGDESPHALPKLSPVATLRSQPPLYSTQAKAMDAADHSAAVRLNGGLAPPPQLETSTVASPASVLAPALGMTSVQHPAARGSKNKYVVAMASSSLPANVTMVGRKRYLLGGGAAYGTRLFMSPTKRTVLSILARAKAAQCKQLVSGCDRHPQPTATNVRVSSSLSDRWTLLVDS